MNNLSSLRPLVVWICASTFLAACAIKAPGQNIFRTLRYFGAPRGDGTNPHGALMMDTNGVLYGTTQQGGTNGQGTIFKINPDGSGYAQLKSFAGNGDGADPVAGLVQGADGALYGTTSWGHDSSGIVTGNGTVFKINPDGSGFQVLHSFAGGTDGANPLYGALIQAADGMLYGTTAYGGGTSVGTVFRLGLDGTNYLVVKRFGAAGEGIQPYGGLIQGADGALYGTTSAGGAASQGTIFRMNPDGSAFMVLHSFSGPDGAIPYVGLIQGQDGALYGTTESGGTNGNGTVFMLNPDGTGYAVLRNLDVNTGVMPLAPLIQGVNGALYGTTSFRGNTNVLLGAGTLFQLNVDGSGFRVLKVFTQTGEGNNPQAGLLQSSGGTLYGTAWGGGPGGPVGSIFSLLEAAVLSTSVSPGGVNIQVAGLPSRVYRIQRSTAPDLSWTDLGTVTTAANGTGKLMDGLPPGSSAIYRTVLP